MKNKKTAQYILILCTILLTSCVFGCSTRENKEKPEIIVAAASSLTDAFTEIGQSFAAENNCIVTFSFGASGTLSEQIYNGAPFDIFAAADVISVDKLSSAGIIIPETTTLFARGQVGLASLKSSSIQISTIEDLLNPNIKKIALPSPEHAPYGIAAKQALINTGLWDKLEAKIIYGKNISEAATFLTTGNAEAGFLSLSINDDNLFNFSIVDSTLYEPLYHAIAVVKGTQKEDLAKSFVEFLLNEKGQEILNKYGLILPLEE